MPTYMCPKCGRTVDMPSGSYSCKVCYIQMRPVEAEAVALPASKRLTPETIGELMRGMSEASRLGQWERYNELKKELNELTRSAMTEEYSKTLGEIDDAIAEEQEAIDDYTVLEKRLRGQGEHLNADIVREIKNDEVDHLNKFQVMKRMMK